MPQARVDSFDALNLFKAALWKFQESATIALGEAESELHRIQMWLETEQQSFWQGQIRKRQEIVSRCKEAVRMKKVFKDSTGRQQSAVDEEKALQLAMRRLEEAEQKLAYTRKWARQIQKEIEMYKGGVARFATDVQGEIPAAAAHLEQLLNKLDAYVNAQVGPSEGTAASPVNASAEPSMARGGAALPDSEELSAFRGAGPTVEQRQTSPAVTVLSFGIPAIPEDQAAAVATLRIERQLIGDQTPIYVSQSVRPGEPAVACRASYGWFVASSDGTVSPGWEVIAADDLLRNHPNWHDLLTLPEGFSVMIGAGGIGAVLDDEDRVVWRRT